MRILCLQHSFFDDPGIISYWSYKRGHELSIIKTYSGEKIPDPKSFDFLIILGGTQSLSNHNDLNAAAEELALIRQAIAENKFVLGICLGAQMIAASFGMVITRSPHPEIGVFPISLTDAGRQDRLFKHFPTEFSVMHMHYDMAQLPLGARLLASSPGCPVQAFALGDRTYGIQFHMEITNENIAMRLGYMKEELGTGIYVATRDNLASSDMSEINQRMQIMLDKISPI